MRLNRSNAQFRDRDREGTGGKGSIQDRACAYVWKELLGKLLEFVSPSQGVVELTCDRDRELEAENGNCGLLCECCGSVHEREAQVTRRTRGRCRG